MKRWSLAAAIFFLCVGCDSENAKKYEFTGYWTFSGVAELCSTKDLPEMYSGELFFETIRVRVYESEEDMAAERVYAETTTPCDEGKFVVDDLKRGTYIVNVAAMAPEPEGEVMIDGGVDTPTDEGSTKTQAFFESTQEVVVPPKDDAPVKFPMEIGTGSIEVSWDFDQGSCAAVWSDAEDDWVEVTEVHVSVEGQSMGANFDETLDCALGKWNITGLTWDIYSVRITAEDTTGAHAFEGAFEHQVEIRPGTRIRGPAGRIVLKEI